jgi:hypothetical protein
VTFVTVDYPDWVDWEFLAEYGARDDLADTIEHMPPRAHFFGEKGTMAGIVTGVVVSSKYVVQRHAM